MWIGKKASINRKVPTKALVLNLSIALPIPNKISIAPTKRFTGDFDKNLELTGGTFLA